MTLISLSHLVELAAHLPNPTKTAQAETGYTAVIRVPIHNGDAIRDTEHPQRESAPDETSFVQFEIVPWKDTKGVTAPRWVLCGLVAM